MLKEGKKFSILMVLGPPGSGKGTQVKMLADKFGFYHFISSHIGKEYINSHSDLETVKQKENYAQGLLFDPEWILEIVKEKTKEIFNQNKDEGGIVYDGSPRTLYEAEGLYSFLSEIIGEENIKIIEIIIDEEELQNRIKNRLICDKSDNHVFIRSGDFQPGALCPEGDGALQERDLDKKEIFDVRMERYKKETVPALDFLKKKHKVITINGNQPVEAVHKDIIEFLKS